MRGLVPGLPSPVPLDVRLPGMYQEDGLAPRLVAAFDAALAPVFCTLDNLDAYLDPHLAPEDFLVWLAEWVGVAVDETWDAARRRSVVARAAGVYRWRGTVRGVREAVEIHTGCRVEVVDDGGVGWSQRPRGASVAPGAGGGAGVVVRVMTPPDSGVDPARVAEVVAAAKPAHVTHVVELVPVAAPEPEPPAPPEPEAPPAVAAPARDPGPVAPGPAGPGPVAPGPVVPGPPSAGPPRPPAAPGPAAGSPPDDDVPPAAPPGAEER